VNRAVFAFSIRRSIRSSLLIAVGVGLFYWVVLLASSSFLGDGTEPLPSFLTEPPRVMKAFIGGSANFVSPVGWMASGVLHPIILSLTTMGAFMIATGTGATELERGTLDLVLARPVGRVPYVAARGLAGLVMLTLVEAGAVAGTFVAYATVPGVDQLVPGRILLMFAGHWLLFAAFSTTCLAIFARASLRSRALGTAIGVVVGAFFLNFLSLLFDALEWLGYLSPFHYFNAADILNGEPFLGSWAVLAAVAVAMGALSLRWFASRDLTR